MSDAGSRSMRSWASLQISDGSWKKLMGIQIDLTVIAVAIVEVPIDTQHVIPLEIAERFCPNLVLAD